MKNKLIIIALILLMSSTILTGCAGDTSATPIVINEVKQDTELRDFYFEGGKIITQCLDDIKTNKNKPIENLDWIDDNINKALGESELKYYELVVNLALSTNEFKVNKTKENLDIVFYAVQDMSMYLEINKLYIGDIMGVDIEDEEEK